MLAASNIIIFHFSQKTSIKMKIQHNFSAYFSSSQQNPNGVCGRIRHTAHFRFCSISNKKDAGCIKHTLAPCWNDGFLCRREPFVKGKTIKEQSRMDQYYESSALSLANSSPLALKKAVIRFSTVRRCFSSPAMSRIIFPSFIMISRLP